MAFKLSRTEIAQRDDFVSELTKLRNELEDAVNVFNAEMEKLKGPVNAAIEAYNTELEKARSFAEDIASDRDGQFGDKSERWQESERGEAVREWIDTWEQAELDDFEVEFPEEMGTDMPDHVETLEQLPEEAES